MTNEDIAIEPNRAKQELVRLSVNMNTETADALKQLAASKGVSYTEAIRRAVSIAKYFDDVTNEGQRIQIVSADRSEVRELLVL